MQKTVIILLLSYCVISCNRNTLENEKELLVPSETGEEQTITVSPNLHGDKNFYFPHKPHVGALECNTCHRGESRRPTIDQSMGHGLCLDCHRQKQEGPIACSGCHKN